MLAVASYGKRSIAWLAVLAASIGGVLFLSTLPYLHSSAVAHSFAEGYGVVIATCIVYCLWVKYNVTRERRFLLATIAFGGIAFSALAHAALSLMSPSPTSQLWVLGSRYAYGWQIAAALLLVTAAKCSTLDDVPTFRRKGKRALVGSLLLSVCVMTVPLVFDPGWLHLRALLPPGITASIAEFLSGLVSLKSMATLCAGASALALVAHIRNFAEQEDEFSKRAVPFLSLAVAASAGIQASNADYDLAWWAGHLLFVCGLMVLLLDLGLQFGSSYADAEARIRHMEAVHYMSSRLTNTLDLRVVLLALVSDTASMLSAKFASVMLSDDSGQTLTTEVTYGLPESPLRPREPQNVEGQGRPGFYSGHTARAFREKRICMVDDVFADVAFLPWKVLARHNGYAISVPLIYHDLALGVLNLFFEKHVPLNDERIRLFQTLASSASVAIVNAQLYDRTLHCESEEADAPFTLRLAS